MADHSINKKVVEFAQDHLGRPVGRGDNCWDLPQQALENSEGAKTSRDYQDITGKSDQDYIWGQEINILGVQPGDILQFRHHEIIIHYIISGKLTMPDGQTVDFSRPETRTLKRGPQHSAIVSGYKGDGVMVIFEQHVNTPGKQKDTVQENQMYISPKDSQKDASFEPKTKYFNLAIQDEVNELYKLFGKKAIDDYRKEYKKGRIKLEEEGRTFEVEVKGIVRAYSPERKK